MGNPNTPEGKAQLERQSPLNSAQKIKTPLLVVQGANDPRVKKAESEQIVIALRDRGFPVEYILAPDEGHGFARPVNNMALLAASEKFLAKHLGGRFQEEMTPEVGKRLNEITVDPKTVVLAKKVETASVGVPKVAFPWSAGKASYAGKIEAGGQTIPMSTTRDDRGGGRQLGRHRHGEDADGRGGRHDDARQGDARPAQALDQAGAGGDRARVRGRQGDRHDGDGRRAQAGLRRPRRRALRRRRRRGRGDRARCRSPRATATTFRNFDVQKQKVQLKQAKVTGAESVTVPAGTFEAWKVEITSAEGEPGQTTLWVAKDSRKVVKISATLPQMGGAVVTSELQP